MALRIGLHELRKLIANGLSQADFEATRDYLMKNVFVMTATQNQQLGYALDSEWYGIREFTSYMRDKLKALTLADVNAAVRKHLSGTDLQVVIVTKDAKGLAEALLADTPSTIRYDAPKPAGARRRGQAHRRAEARPAAGRRHDHPRGRRLREMSPTPLPESMVQLQSINPTDGSLIREYPEATEAEVEGARRGGGGVRALAAHVVRRARGDPAARGRPAARATRARSRD